MFACDMLTELFHIRTENESESGPTEGTDSYLDELWPFQSYSDEVAK